MIAEDGNDLKKILGTLEQAMDKDLHMEINAKIAKV